jgi:hypothetical protein
VEKFHLVLHLHAAEKLSNLLTLILFAILTQSQNFGSDDASSAILVASMMVLDPSCAYDKESLRKAVRDRKLF